jgi:hypothetical protein
MTEPTIPAGVGIVGIGVATLGPMAGPYAVIVVSALAGAMWALAAAPTATRSAGAMLVLRLVLTAVMLTGGVAWLLETQYQWPVYQVLAPVAFVIGMVGDRWRSVFDAMLALGERWITKRTGGDAS